MKRPKNILMLECWVKNILNIQQKELHKYAARLLDEGKVDEAWQVLLADI